MSITPYLQGHAFDPEVTEAMGIAFGKACLTLGLSPTPDPATRHVAEVVIALAERGYADAEELYNGVLEHFGKAA
jgi:hypothetical protein